MAARTYRIWIFVLLSLVAIPASAEPTVRPDWAPHFEQAGVTGTLVVVDRRVGESWMFDPERAAKRFLPASTFKIPHAIFALEAGVVADEFQVFPWDGEERTVAAWNRDQDLRSSIRASAVWLYREFARQIGAEKEREYLRRVGYGNGEISDQVDNFWLDSSLRISALEQVEFLERLYRNQLPFAVEHQRLVKDLMIVEAGRDWILRAKTGWGVGKEVHLGWWVGWVEHPEGPVFFALNIDMPRRGEDAPKREAIVREILRSIDALPRAPD